MNKTNLKNGLHHFNKFLQIKEHSSNYYFYYTFNIYNDALELLSLKYFVWSGF